MNKTQQKKRQQRINATNRHLNERKEQHTQTSHFDYNDFSKMFPQYSNDKPVNMNELNVPEMLKHMDEYMAKSGIKFSDNMIFSGPNGERTELYIP